MVGGCVCVCVYNITAWDSLSMFLSSPWRRDLVNSLLEVGTEDDTEMNTMTS